MCVITGCPKKAHRHNGKERYKEVEDKDLVIKAFNFSKKAHEGQIRESGNPYFFHVFETAKTLAELGMGSTVIAAGLTLNSKGKKALNQERALFLCSRATSDQSKD